MGAWLTIDSPGDVVCRQLSIPVNFIPHLKGAIGELCDPRNWEQHGTLTPEECVDLMAEVWYSVQECE